MSIVEKDKVTYSRNYVKLAQFAKDLEDLCQTDPAVLKRLYEYDADINYRIPIDSIVRLHSPNLLGFTALHFAVVSGNTLLVESLLRNGADCTIKCYGELTPIRLAIDRVYHKNEKCFNGMLRHPMVETLLRAQVKAKNAANPRCVNGVSHFHIACMVNDENAIKFFLETGEVPVDEAINADSIILPGYTGLHLAARYSSLNVAKVLLQHGANVEAREAEGMSPLHLLVARKLKIIDDCPVRRVLNVSFDKSEVDIIDELMEVLVSRVSGNVDKTGISLHHLACMRTQKSALLAPSSSLPIDQLESFVNTDSPICPGYTALHFAAHFSLPTTLMLLKNGANFKAKDAHGMTALDICLQEYTPKSIAQMLLTQDSNCITLSEGTQLVTVLRAMNDFGTFQELLRTLTEVNAFVPFDSDLWTGYNLLHLAVVFRSTKYWIVCSQIIQHCIARGVSLGTRNAHGLTPLHLAFRLRNEKAVKCILDNFKIIMVTKLADPENLTHLHVACTIGLEIAVYRLLQSGADVNAAVRSGFEWNRDTDGSDTTFVVAGSTALHIAVYFGRLEVVKLLLRFNADPCIRNECGLNPIQLAFLLNESKILDHLWEKSNTNYVHNTINEGVLYIHIACFLNDMSFIYREYFQSDIDINAPLILTEANRSVSEFTQIPEELVQLSTFTGWTPLHFAVEGRAFEAAKFLIGKDANFNARNRTGMTPLQCAMFKDKKFLVRILECIDTNTLMDVDDYQGSRVTGLTRLHVACMRFNVENVLNCLRSGEDVNARVFDAFVNSGDTALHILIDTYNDWSTLNEDKFIHLIKILLDFGADIFIKNNEGFTPLHLVYQFQCHNPSVKYKKVIDLLLESPVICQENPINNEGLSHFHICCTRNYPETVLKFLQSGVDVDHAKDYFAYSDAGFTATYFALLNQNAATLDILLKYGADPCKQDRFRRYPLIVAAQESKLNAHLIEQILKTAKSKIEVENMYIDVLDNLSIDSEVSPIVEVFLKYGTRTNILNPKNSQGLLASLFQYSLDEFKFVLDNATDLLIVSVENGFNAIHNLVSIPKIHQKLEDYAKAIERLVEKGCKLDHRDNAGRTPVHVALEWKNLEGLQALLMAGAAVNIQDASGKTPLAMSKNLTERLTRVFLIQHVDKLTLCGLTQHPSYSEYKKLRSNNSHNLSCIYRCFMKKLQSLKRIHLDRGFTLYVLTRERIVADYSRLPLSCRQAIERILSADDFYNKFTNVSTVLKYQYRRARMRFDHLFVPAMEAAQLLTDLTLPDPCADCILWHLSNEDLINLIVAVTNKRPDC